MRGTTKVAGISKKVQEKMTKVWSCDTKGGQDDFTAEVVNIVVEGRRDRERPRGGWKVGVGKLEKKKKKKVKRTEKM